MSDEFDQNDIDRILEKYDELTQPKIVLKKKEGVDIFCPRCNSTRVVFEKTQDGIAYYSCADCKKHFGVTPDSML
jgi:transposase-like protein